MNNDVCGNTLNQDFEDSASNNFDFYTANEEETFEMKTRGNSFFNHINIFRRLWEYLIMFICMFSVIEILTMICIFENVNIRYYSIFLVFDVIFLIDLFIVRRTAITYRGQPIYDRETLKLFYGIRYIIIHIIAFLPLSWIGVLLQSKTLYLCLSINKLLRFYRAYLAYHNSTTLLSYIGSVLSIVPIIYLMIFSNIFFSFVLMLTAKNKGYIDTFLDQFYQRGFNTFQLFFTTIYYVLTTILTIGFGDISPKSKLESIMTMIVQLVGVTLQAILASDLVAIFIEPEENEYVQNYKIVQEFLRYKYIDDKDRKEIRNFCQYKLDKTGGFGNVQLILNRVPPSLRCTIKLELTKEFFNKTNGFRTLNRHQLSRIVEIMIFRTYTPNDIIIREGEISDKIFFFKQGVFTIIIDGTPVMTLPCNENKVIGEFEMCTGAANKITLSTLTFLECWIIKKDVFLKLINKKKNLLINIITNLLTFFPDSHDKILETLIPDDGDRILIQNYLEENSNIYN